MPQDNQKNNHSLGNSETYSWVMRTKYSPTIYYRLDGFKKSSFPINRDFLDRESLEKRLKQPISETWKLPPSHPMPSSPNRQPAIHKASFLGSNLSQLNALHSYGRPSSLQNNNSFSRRCPSPEPELPIQETFKGARAKSKRFSSPQKKPTDEKPRFFIKGKSTPTATPSSPLFNFLSPSRSSGFLNKEMKCVPSWPNLVQESGSNMKAVETAKEWMVDLSKLFVGQKFACGAHSRLYHGIYDEKPVAVKVILQPEEEENEEMAIKLERQFDREVTILSHLHHRNIVQLVAACRNPPVFCIITEYLSGGSLRSYLHKREPGSVSLEEFISISLDIARGVEYLHSQGIIHRDLKSENVLFAGDKCIKIVDFGIACEEIHCDFLEEDRGTYRWMAPEVINHKPHNRKVDVYSLGIVLWEIFTGRVPYEDMIPVQAAFAVVHKNARPAIPEHCPIPVQRLIEKCWAQNPDKRPESYEIVKILEQFECAIRADGNINQCPILCSGEKKHGTHLWKKLGGRITGTAAISPSPPKSD